MSRSEIDEIFAAPPKKKAKTSPSEQQNVPAKSRHPETILDPSKKQASRKQRREKKTNDDDDDRFKDSRGSVPRRKTADGYTIYKEDELGISTTGGGERFIHSLRSILNTLQTQLSARLTANAVFESCIPCCTIVNISPQESESFCPTWSFFWLYRSFAGLALVAVVCEVNV